MQPAPNLGYNKGFPRGVTQGRDLGSMAMCKRRRCGIGTALVGLAAAAAAIRFVKRYTEAQLVEAFAEGRRIERESRSDAPHLDSALKES